MIKKKRESEMSIRFYYNYWLFDTRISKARYQIAAYNQHMTLVSKLAFFRIKNVKSPIFYNDISHNKIICICVTICYPWCPRQRSWTNTILHFSLLLSYRAKSWGWQVFRGDPVWSSGRSWHRLVGNSAQTMNLSFTTLQFILEDQNKCPLSAQIISAF